MEAYILDASKGRSELSAEQPNLLMPVNQTLEDLLMGDPTAEKNEEGSDEVPLEPILPAMLMQCNVKREILPLRASICLASAMPRVSEGMSEHTLKSVLSLLSCHQSVMFLGPETAHLIQRQ